MHFAEFIMTERESFSRNVKPLTPQAFCAIRYYNAARKYVIEIN